VISGVHTVYPPAEHISDYFGYNCERFSLKCGGWRPGRMLWQLGTSQSIRRDSALQKCRTACLLFSLALLCAGQTSSRPEVIRAVAPTTKRDPKLEEAIRREIGDSRYAYAYDRVDLHGSGEQEVLVYLPGSDYCGSGGCTSLVFAFRGGDYLLVSRLSLTRPPVMVSSHRTNGWKDLVIFVSGGGIQPGYYAVLRFDGQKYPENPTTVQATPLKKGVRCVAYLAGAEKAEFDIVVSPH